MEKHYSPSQSQSQMGAMKSCQTESSLPVPKVQELAKEATATVPTRYIHLDREPSVDVAGDSLPSIPTIDMGRLLLQESTTSELERLISACRDWGFFQLVNHGMSTSLIERMKSETQELFKLSIEEKKRYWPQPGNLDGFGQAFVVSENQKLDWSDIIYLVTLPTHQRKQSLFEKLPSSFRETIETYAVEQQKLGLTILGLVSRALGMNVEEMRELFEDGIQRMRINYYPPCPQPELAIGLSPHSDARGLTILLQINEVQGLEIKKDGTWIPVKPIPNAFVVNVGDMLELITNGACRSVLHRATVNSVQERLSIATFYSPKPTAVIGPSLSLIDTENPPLYRSDSGEVHEKLHGSGTERQISLRGHEDKPGEMK